MKAHYLSTGAIRQLTSAPKHCCSAFLVPKKTGGFRLVVDLRPINKYFPTMSTTYETLSWLQHVPRSVVAGASLDLQDGYHHIRLHPAIRKYFNFNVNGSWYECVALPFGWSLAPAIFTKLMRPVLAIIRSPALVRLPESLLLAHQLAITASIYLDDLLVLITAH